MLQDAADEVSATFAEASAVLGYDLWELVSTGPEEQLNQTEFTQPALLTASVALYRLAQSSGTSTPDLVAGHSLGEYSALVAAGVIEFTDAVALVQKRGQLMQSAVPVGEGGMAAILGLDDDQIKQICEIATQNAGDNETVEAANFNANGQTVIAGSNAALQAAIEACKESGAKRAMPLAVSAPFHSSLMKPAAEKMSEALNAVSFSDPNIPIVQNVDASIHTDPSQIRDNLVTQMYGPVRWTESVVCIKEFGVEVCVECGPGKVLTGLAKRIDKSLTGVSINSGASVAEALEALN